MHAAGGGRHRDLADDRAHDPGVGFQADDLRGDVEGDRRHGEHAPGHPEHRPDGVERLDGIAEEFPESREDEVSHGVARQSPGSAVAVLEQAGQLLVLVVVGGECAQCHPEVPGGQDVEFAPETPGGTAVVGDGHHRGHVVGHHPSGAQGRRQPVSSAEGDE